MKWVWSGFLCMSFLMLLRHLFYVGFLLIYFCFNVKLLCFVSEDHLKNQMMHLYLLITFLRLV